MVVESNNKMWPNTSAIVVSDESHLYLLMKELVRSYGWKIDMPPCNAPAALEYLRHGQAACIIVIDSSTCPANESLRILFRDPRARLTPVIALISEPNKYDERIYEKIFRVAVAVKPLTPNNFIPTFKHMIQKWQEPAMRALRRISYMPQGENSDLKKAILEKLFSDSNSLPFALSAYLQILIDEGRFKEAERKLMDIFKAQPNNAVLLAQCGWFYIAARMPQQALLFLTKLKSITPMSTIFNFDIASAHLACGNLDKAIENMQTWHQKHPGNDFMESFMARILAADGKSDYAETIGVSKGVMRKVTEYWDLVETAGKESKGQTDTENKAS